MSISIVPYSAVTEAAQDLSDFSFVKEFWKCHDLAGSGFILGENGVNLTAAGLTRPNANSVQTSTLTNQAIVGELAALGSAELPVFFAVAEFGAVAQFILGSSSDDGIALNLKTTTPDIQDPATGIDLDGTTFTLTTAATVYGRALAVSAYDSATGLQTYQFDTGTTATNLGDTPSSAASTGGIALTGMMKINTNWRCATALPIYGMAYFGFDAIPADLLVGLHWMTIQWAAGNKVIYPGWKGL